MKPFITCFVLSLITLSLHSQNLINHFTFYSGTQGPWYGILTVDYYENNSSTGQEGRVYTADGFGCAGVRSYSAGDPNWQEYIYQYIGNEMQMDTVYRVSIKYRLAPRCSMATDAMGIGFFSGYDYFNQITSALIQQKVPEIRNTPGNLLDNNDAYQELVGYYKATGNESFVVFGSFATDATMTRKPSTKGPPYQNAWTPNPFTGKPFEDILYYMDMASIVPCKNYPPDPFPDQRIFCVEQLTQLSAPPIGNAQFLWSTGDTTSQIEVHAHNQEIWLEITKNGCVRRDTVKLTVFSGAIDLGDDRKICSSEELPIEFSANSLSGEQVLWNSGHTESLFSASQDGTYWVQKTLDDCIARDTVTITNLENSLLIYPNPVEKYLFAGSSEEIKILQIQTEDGKTVFKGEETPELLADFIEALTPAVYFLTASVDKCIVKEKFVRISK